MRPQRSQDAPRGLAEELAALQNLTVAKLKQRWRALYRTEPPARISRPLLLQAVAYRLQEQAWGGLKSSTRRALERIAAESGAGSATQSPATRLTAGTALIREWHGVSHAVTVLEDGAQYRGRRYRSLSAVMISIS